MSAQILYSFVMLLNVFVHAAAVRWASLIHFYSSSLLPCATSVGCYSSNFAPILGCHADASFDSAAAASSGRASSVCASNFQD